MRGHVIRGLHLLGDAVAPSASPEAPKPRKVFRIIRISFSARGLAAIKARSAASSPPSIPRSLSACS